MAALQIIGSILRLILRIVLLPVQAILTMLMCILGFAGSMFGIVFRIAGGAIMLGAFAELLYPPANWFMFWETLVAGAVIGSLPEILTNWGEMFLGFIKESLSKI